MTRLFQRLAAGDEARRQPPGTARLRYPGDSALPLPPWHVARGLLVLALTLGSVVWLLAPSVGGQPISFGRVKNFIVPEYYDPPKENQLKSRLTGAEAEPQAGGLYRLREVKAETYREDGEVDFVIQAAECTYESKQRAIRSPGRLQAKTGDGRLTIEGDGFLWQQTTGKLIISNRVHTVIQQPPRGAEPKKP